MRQRLCVSAAILALAVPVEAAPPPPATALKVLPANDRCSMQLGTFSSSLGPVQLEMSLDRQHSSLHLTRDGLAGHGEGEGIARMSGARTETLSFSHRLGADSYSFDATSYDQDLLELLATSRTLTVAPLTDSQNKSLGVPTLFMSSAPHFTVTLGDLAPLAAKLAECGGYLALADKTGFCAHIDINQANQGCPVSSWRMAANDEQQVDWIDTNRVKHDGTSIQFVSFTQHWRRGGVIQPADRNSAVRIVTGDCASRAYTTKMFATFDESNQEIAMKVDAAPSAEDRLVDQDVVIACSGHWRSQPVDEPDAETREFLNGSR